MSVQTDFEKEFETEEYEMLILVQASCGGAACIKDMLKPSVDFLASIDLRNGQFFHEKGRVESRSRRREITSTISVSFTRKCSASSLNGATTVLSKQSI